MVLDPGNQGDFLKTFAKLVIQIFGFMAIVLLAGFIGWLIRDCQPRPRTPLPAITEQLKNIQRQVGCKKIDAVIGPETTALINAEVEKEKRELFNQYAKRFMTATGAPTGK